MVRATPKHIRGPINLKPGPSATPKQAVREAKDRDPGTVKHSSDDSEDTALSSYIPTKREEQKRLLLEKSLFEEEEKRRKEEEKQRKEEEKQRTAKEMQRQTKDNKGKTK